MGLKSDRHTPHGSRARAIICRQRVLPLLWRSDKCRWSKVIRCHFVVPQQNVTPTAGLSEADAIPAGPDCESWPSVAHCGPKSQSWNMPMPVPACSASPNQLKHARAADRPLLGELGEDFSPRSLSIKVPSQPAMIPPSMRDSNDHILLQV